MSEKRGRRARPRWSSTWVWAIAGALVAAGVIGGIFAARKGGGSPAIVRDSSPVAVQLAGKSPVTGREVSLSDYAGKPVVLNVWASWCTGCRVEARDLAEFARAHPEAQLIGLNTQDSDEDAQAFYREFGWTHPSIRDPSGEAAARLGLQGLPTTIFLDREHRIVTRIIGASDAAGFAEGLRSVDGAS